MKGTLQTYLSGWRWGDEREQRRWWFFDTSLSFKGFSRFHRRSNNALKLLQSFSKNIRQRRLSFIVDSAKENWAKVTHCLFASCRCDGKRKELDGDVDWEHNCFLETFSTFDTFNCSSSSQTFTSHARTSFFDHKLAPVISSQQWGRKIRKLEKISNEPPQQRTARRIFHKISFHEVFIPRRTTWDFGDGNFSELSMCLCKEKSSSHRHIERRPRKCDSATPEFLRLSVCVRAVSLNTKILQRAENAEKFSLPLQQLPWDFTVLAEMTWIRVERGKWDSFEENALCPSWKSGSSCQNGWDDVRIFVSLRF